MSKVKEYDVFLCFRGLDSRQSLADVLYHDIRSKDLAVFRDDNEIEIGNEISEVFSAIKNSKICVLIFSRNFAASAWCLREVKKMVKLGKVIMPIFYTASPADVKLSTELFGKDLRKHEEQHGKERVRKWEDALKTVAMIKGLEVKNMGYTDFGILFLSALQAKLKDFPAQISVQPEVPLISADHLENLQFSDSEVVNDTKNQHATLEKLLLWLKSFFQPVTNTIRPPDIACLHGATHQADQQLSNGFPSSDIMDLSPYAVCNEETKTMILLTYVVVYETLENLQRNGQRALIGRLLEERYGAVIQENQRLRRELEMSKRRLQKSWLRTLISYKVAFWLMWSLVVFSIIESAFFPEIHNCLFFPMGWEICRAA